MLQTTGSAFVTDTHAHLDRIEDIHEAADSSLRAIVTIGTDPDRNDRALEIAGRYGNVYAAVGIHPGDATLVRSDEARTRVAQQATQPKVVGIGETGFDTHWDDTTLTEQQEAFDWQASLARELDLPLILHVRDRQGTRGASAAACSALKSAGWPRGILHCFNGDTELLATGLELGWYVSFAGNVTYKSATDIQEAAHSAPLERVLVETDSPFLSPVPHRGKPNRPALVRHTADFIAGLRNMDPAELEAQLDDNAARVYRLPG